MGAEDDLGRSPLHYATHTLDCVEILVEQGADVMEKDKSGASPLLYGLFLFFVFCFLFEIHTYNDLTIPIACESGHDDAVRFFVLRGANPDDPDNSGKKCSGFYFYF